MEGDNGPSKKSSNVLWRFLGNDTHNHDDGLKIHSQGTQRKIPSQFSIWLGALQHMRLSKALEGIRLSNNAGLLIIFLGFGVWLFVVYAVRHHDPWDKPIESAPIKAVSHHRQLDEHLVSRMSAALPLKLYQDDVHLYVTGTNSHVSVPEQQSPQINSAQTAVPQEEPYVHYGNSTGAGAAIGAETGTFGDPRFGAPLSPQIRPEANFGFNSNMDGWQSSGYPGQYQVGQIYNTPAPQPMPVFNTPPTPKLNTGGPVSFVTSADGSRLKIFVNR